MKSGTLLGHCSPKHIIQTQSLCGQALQSICPLVQRELQPATSAPLPILRLWVQAICLESIHYSSGNFNQRNSLLFPATGSCWRQLIPIFPALLKTESQAETCPFSPRRNSCLFFLSQPVIQSNGSPGFSHHSSCSTLTPAPACLLVVP